MRRAGLGPGQRLLGVEHGGRQRDDQAAGVPVREGQLERRARRADARRLALRQVTLEGLERLARFAGEVMPPALAGAGQRQQRRGIARHLQEPAVPGGRLVGGHVDRGLDRRAAPLCPAGVLSLLAAGRAQQRGADERQPQRHAPPPDRPVLIADQHAPWSVLSFTRRPDERAPAPRRPVLRARGPT
ncbi:MAG: hypothetical protein H6704_21330 [Myxococcales bacterium]|nr:hypothetical protein [Myxococcales bacterium]